MRSSKMTEWLVMPSNSVICYKLSLGMILPNSWHEDVASVSMFKINVFRILHISIPTLHEYTSPNALLLYDTWSDLTEQDLKMVLNDFNMVLWWEYSWIQIHSLLTLNIIQVHIFPVHSFMGNVTQMKNPYRLMFYIFDHLCFLLPRKSPLPLLLSLLLTLLAGGGFISFLLFYLLLVLVSPL